ncbi:MAG: CHASE domain-containing protein [Rhodospirillaceae bacterium]|nr:CHASE domain-containing protein [Rhodospirillaceae bacterium]
MPRTAPPTDQPDRIGVFSYGLTLALGAIGYFAMARLGLSLATLHASASPIWPASGLATALLVAFGPRFWPAIVAGAFAANLLSGDPLTAAAISIGNTAEALLGQWLIRRLDSLSGDHFPIGRAAGFAMAALFAPLASAGIGVGTLMAAGQLGAAPPADVVMTWWAGDALGILLIAPPLLALRSGMTLPSLRYVIPLALATLASNGLAFLLPGWGAAVFLSFPILILAVRWGGTFGVTFVVLLTSILWLAGTSNGMGPFNEPRINDSLINMQIMLAPLAIAGLVLAEVRGSRPLIPAAVYLVGGLISCAIFVAVSATENAVDDRHMATVITRLESHISDRMNLYINALKGGASLFAASREVKSTEWAAYANSLDLTNQFPGINGMGVIIPVNKRFADPFAEMMRIDLGTDFAIKPVPNVSADAAAFPQHFVIIYAQPEVRNQAAIGLDVASEPRRRAAAIAARDTGKPTLTSRITLVQDVKRGPGFLAFVPIYRDLTEPLEPNGAKGRFSGWIYAPFIAEAFFREALINQDQEMRLRVFDGPRADAAELIFDSAVPVEKGG